MNDSDVRDERLAEHLDGAVRGLQPAMSPERAIRKGRWRRGLRLAASIVTVVAFGSGAILAAAIVRSDGGEPAGTSTMVTFTSPEAPWTFEYTSAWNVRTLDRAGPKLRANLLRTTVANVSIPSDPEYGPNSSANATSLFGDAGAVVMIERLWTHAAPVGGESRGPRRFANDAQNPGWTYRERARCEGTLCFHVIEWHGPAASEEEVATAATIAESARLASVERWAETDGVRTTLHDEDDRFTVTYPPDWSVSDVPINDWVSSPSEILAIATYPLRAGGEAVVDFQLPSNAVEDLGPNDILIWVNETDDAGAFAERPARLEPSEPCGGEDWRRLCPEPTGRTPRLSIPGIHAWWLGFGDAGRGFYAFVGMGEQAHADPARAQLAWDVLDSLRFLPR
jgi:hypothetical protein